MTFPIPAGALTQHTSVLGKTGSGKTSTSKLIVEHVVAQGARACILDPIKSDWWGLTSSSDGRRPGLPFQILGGPHGHVPLHDGAGAAIGELVATGALPLSILDMADFGPGGQSRFFAAFAPALMRHMRGVLYLVLEEAHEFAPKERAGHSEENMALHYAKKLATAGRSKGIRLIVCTQRVQALHNAILGSCDTLIAHRIVAPADQAPVVAWLKGAVKDKLAREHIEQSLPQLPVGSGWICSGEAQLLERVQFPRIATFDNSRTPAYGDDEHRVVTAQVDLAQLRSLIGDAVQEAEAKDPAKLKARVRELEAQLAQQQPAVASPEQQQAADQAGYQRGLRTGFPDGWDSAIDEAGRLLGAALDAVAALRGKHAQLAHGRSSARHAIEGTGGAALRGVLTPAVSPAPAEAGSQAGADLPRMARAILTALAQHPEGLSKKRTLLLADYSANGATAATFAEQTRNGWIEGGKDLLRITSAGLDALGPFEQLPTGKALRDQILASAKLSAMEKAFLPVLFRAYPKGVSKVDLLCEAQYSANGATAKAFAHLVSLGYVTIPQPRMLRAAEELFT